MDGCQVSNPPHLHGFSVLLQVELQRLNIVVKAESGHRKENVFAIDRLSLLSLTSFTCLTVKRLRYFSLLTFSPCDEGDELADTLLHAFPGLLSHLARVGHHLLHHLGDVVDGQEPVLLPQLPLPGPLILILLLLDDVLLTLHHLALSVNLKLLNLRYC